jgi:methylamine dehydrogenase accessory protein MauD
MSTLWIASYIALWIIVAVLAIIVMGLLRQLGLIQLRLGIDPGVLITPEGLERGTAVPDFEARDVHAGDLIRLRDFRGQRVVLVFLTPTCVACRELAPHLNEVMHAYRGTIELLTVLYGAEASCMEFARQFKLQTRLLADPTNSIAASYDVRATPFAFLINEDGIVLIRGVVNSWPQLEALIEQEGTLQGERPWQLVTKAADPLTLHDDPNGVPNR